MNKYYFDWLYTDVIVRAIKGPIARAAYWFNQKVLDGVVNSAGASSVKAGQFVYDRSTKRWSTPSSTAPAPCRGGQRPGPPPDPDRRVQQYAALLFAATAVLRRRADHRHLGNQDQNGTMDNNEFLTDWGLSLMVFLPLAGALLMMLIPKGEEQLLKVVALGASLASAAVGVAVMADFDYDDAGTLQFVVDHEWIDVINGRTTSSASTASRCRSSRSRC